MVSRTKRLAASSGVRTAGGNGIRRIFFLQRPPRPRREYRTDGDGISIFTDGDDLDSLKANVRDAVRCHFEPSAVPKVVRLHFVRDEVITV